MSRPPTRPITLRVVRRTLTRLQTMTRLDQAKLAKQLLPYRHNVQFLAQYLEDVSYYMRQQGYDPNPQQRHPKCLHCGGENSRDHNGARYCSDRCRQRAYRLRLNDRPCSTKRNEPAIRDTSNAMVDETNVTPV
jgi:hypothetical protein